MSDSTTSPRTAPPQPIAADALSDERKQELRRRWEECFAGRVDPALLLRFPPEVMEVFRRDHPRPLKPDIHKRFIEQYAFSYFFGHDSPVICLETPEGVAVLATGGDEMLWFYASATREQINRARVEYPSPWGEWE